MEKFMEYYPLTKNENFFYLDNKKIYINSILRFSIKTLDKTNCLIVSY